MLTERLHRHYLLQARWLAEGRAHLFRRAGLAARQRILDFGCGTGALTAEAGRAAGRPVLGVDRDESLIAFARRAYPGGTYRVGDEDALLRRKERFDLVFLSFVLMWQQRPIALLRKLRRLLASDGVLLVLAEPDYGGRIDHPPPLAEMGRIFRDHVLSSGGDPEIGRKLPGLLAASGFLAETGVFAQQPVPLGSAAEWDEEWGFWQEAAGLEAATVSRLRRLDARARRNGCRVMSMPVFHALARPAGG